MPPNKEVIMQVSCSLWYATGLSNTIFFTKDLHMLRKYAIIYKI